jgi:hypothetical protein
MFSFDQQIRFVWVPAQQTCVRVNIEGSELALVAVPVADIALLLIMLVGLLRLRRRGGGMSDLAQVLWKQVSRWSLPAVDLCTQSCGFRSDRVQYGSCLLSWLRFLQW